MTVSSRDGRGPRASEKQGDHSCAILETVPNSIVITNALGNIEIFNLASEPIFQYTAEEVTGEHIGLLFPCLAELGDEQGSGEFPLAVGQEVETLARRRDGSTFPIELAVGAMNVEGQGHLVCVIRDITARKRAEEEARDALTQLIQAEKLASLGGLVAGVAHEINTPVGVSVTAASHLGEQTECIAAAYRAGTLKRSALEQFLEHAAQAAKILITNLTRASELIYGFKQVAVDRSTSERRRFRVKRYMEEVLLSLRPKLKDTAPRVSLECDESLEIDGYPGVLSQILTNLIVNALVHAYEPGQAGHIRIGVQARDCLVELTFSDDGNGIPPEDRKCIFDPFFTTRRGEGGNGLGLHIVHNLVVTTLRGTISCESGPQGTRFLIRFPRAPEKVS
jgi:PAS domain S-box-containing protein